VVVHSESKPWLNF
jgi:hypothetical protein